MDVSRLRPGGVVMNSWVQLAEKLSTDNRLRELRVKQVQAVIDMLCLVMFADNRVSALEEVEFNECLFKLPFLDEQRDVVSSQVNLSSSKARYANSPEDRANIAQKAADELQGSEVGEAVFEMAACMAFSDLVYHVREQEVLRVLSSALALEDQRAEAIIASFR